MTVSCAPRRERQAEHDLLFTSIEKISPPIMPCSTSFSSTRLFGSILSYLTRSLTASGMNGARSRSSRFWGMATWILLAIASIREPRIFCSTR